MSDTKQWSNAEFQELNKVLGEFDQGLRSLDGALLGVGLFNQTMYEYLVEKGIIDNPDRFKEISVKLMEEEKKRFEERMKQAEDGLTKVAEEAEQVASENKA